MTKILDSEEEDPPPAPSEEPTMEGTMGEMSLDDTFAVDQAQRTLGGEQEASLSAGERYRFDELLGRGGMGEVWRVGDRHLEREVALKRMRKDGATPYELARFLREAQLSGSLEHPNIVPIYDLGVDAEGALFFTMKQLRGRTLAQLLGDGKLGSRLDRLTIFRKVCDAMAFAHAREVIHRDLKPDNVMIGEFGEVMVLDWGIAKRLDERTSGIATGRPVDLGIDLGDVEGADASELTIEGSLMGTPAFMAPEQALGRQHLVDTRTDIYALGILLYILLTGERPFRGSVAAVLLQVSRGEFDAPSVRAQVPRELEAIVLRAMALEPNERYASVAALSADVQAYLEERPVSVVSYSAVQRLQKWVGRNRQTVAAAGAIGAMGLTALFVGGVAYLRDVTAARDRAELARDEAAAARDEAAAARDRALSAEREAQIREGDAQVGLAFALARGGDFIAAVDHLDAARGSFERTGASTLAVDFVHAWVDGKNPPPLTRYELPNEATVLGVSPDGQRIAWHAGEHVAVDDWLVGERLIERDFPSMLTGGLGAHADDFVVLIRRGGSVEVRTLFTNEVLSTLPDGGVHRLCADQEHVLIEGEDGQNQRWSLSAGEARGAAFDCGGVMSMSGDCGRVSCDAERRPPPLTAKRTDIWDAVAGRKLRELASSNTKDFSFDGRLMLTSIEHDGVQLWDLDRGELLWWDQTPVRAGPGYFSADGQRIYAQSPEGWLHQWTREGEWLGRRRLDGLVFGPVGEPYLFTNSVGSFAVWSSGPGAHAEIEIEPESAWSGAVGEGELVGVLAGQPNVIYDPLTGATLSEFAEDFGSLRSFVDIDKDGRVVLGQTRGMLLHFELARSSDPVGRLELPTDDGTLLTALRLFPGREAALIADGEGRLHIWDFDEQAVVARYETGQYVWQMDVDPEGRRAYLSGRLATQTPLTVIDLVTGERVFESPSRVPGYGVSVLQRAAQTMFAVGTQTGLVEVWVEGQPEPLARLHEVDVPIMSLDFTPDGELLAADTYTGELLVWTTRDWRPLPALPIDLPMIHTSADSRRFLGRGVTFDLDLTVRGEATHLDFPAAGETREQRVAKLIAGLALQRDWVGADRLIEGARAEGVAVDELLAGRIAWKLGDTERALIALERVDPATVNNAVELEIWLRIARETRAP